MQSTRFVYTVEIAAANGGGHDRAQVFDLGDDLVIALADGAGGTGNGATAAQSIIDAVSARARTSHDWGALLEELDGDLQRLGNGQSTAVIVSVRSSGISGVSVGDSGVWLVHETNVIDVTDGQHRKPLVGAGCIPWPISSMRFGGGTLLVASDGLLRYAKRNDIARVASNADLREAARALIHLVRLPNGTLQDDVAVVLCRERLTREQRSIS